VLRKLKGNLRACGPDSCLSKSRPAGAPVCISFSIDLNARSTSGRYTKSGRYLVRPSDSLFLAPQSDSEKKTRRHSKELREKRPNPGCFWFTAVGGRTFWRRKNLGVASLVSEWQKRRTRSPNFVSLISYASVCVVVTQRLQCITSKQALPNSTC
jgi:hypothetical protein